MSLMHRYPNQLHSLLVYGGSSLNVETMPGLFHFGSPREDERESYSTYIQTKLTKKEGVFSLLNVA